MRFTSTARPTLTPLGHRLLHLSESKLANLEPGIGGRDTAAAMWKGVLVREAVKSAWKSVDQGATGNLTDWSSKSAMGLDIIGEDAEEEEEVEEEEEEGRWFEDLVSSFGEEDFEHHDAYSQWKNAGPAYEETARPYSITSDTTDFSSSASAIQYGVVSADLILTSGETEVEVVEVSYDDNESESEYEESIPEIESLYLTPHVQPLQPILIPRAFPIAPVPTSLTPISPFTLNDNIAAGDDLDEMSDSFLLPPPLVRSFSSASTSSLPDEECVTPPARSYAELEDDDEEEEDKVEDGYAMTKRLMSGGWLGLQLDDRSEVLLA